MNAFTSLFDKLNPFHYIEDKDPPRPPAPPAAPGGAPAATPPGGPYMVGTFDVAAPRQGGDAQEVAGMLAGKQYKSWADIDADLRGRTAEDIAAIKQAYEAQTGKSWDARFGSDAARWDPQLAALGEKSATDLAKTGFASDAEVDAYFTGKPRVEIEAIRREYDRVNGEGSFDQRFSTNANELGKWARDDASVNGAKATEDVDAILAAKGWAGTTYDQEAMLRAIRGKSKAELDAMRKVFAEKCPGESMDRWIVSAMGGITGAGAGGDLAEARASLTGNPIASAVATLGNSADGGYTGIGADRGKMMEVLEGLDDNQRKAVIERYNSEHPGEDLDAMLVDELYGNDEAQADALVDGDKVKAAAIGLDTALHGNTWLSHTIEATGVFGTGTDGAAAEEAFAKVKKIEEATGEKGLTDKLLENYAAHNGSEGLSAEQARALFKKDADWDADGADLHVLEGLADGDEAKVKAAKIEIARDDGDKDAMADAMGMGIKPKDWRKLSPKEQAEKLAAHKELMAKVEGTWGTTYGKGFLFDTSFDTMLEETTAGDEDYYGENLELDRLKMIKDGGRMDDAFQMYYSMKRVGTRDDLMEDAVAGTNEEQAAKLKADFKTLAEGRGYQGDDAELQTWIDGDASDRLHHDMTTALQYGTDPEKLQNKLKKESTDFDFELGSGEGVLGGVVEMGSDAADRMRRQHEKILALSQGLEFDENGAPRNLSPEKQAEIEKLVNWQGADKTKFRADADSVADGAATALEMAAMIAVTVATGGGSAGWWLKVLGTEAAKTGALVAGMTSAGLGGVLGMGAKKAILGGGYGMEKAGTDAVLTGAKVLTAGALKTEFVDDGITSLIDKMGKVPGLAKLAETEAGKKLLQQVFSGAGGALNAAAGELVKSDNYTGKGGAGEWDALLAVLGGAAGGAWDAYLGEKIKPVSEFLGGGNEMAGDFIHGALKSTAGAATSAETYKGEVGLNFLGQGLKGGLENTVESWGDRKVEVATHKEDMVAQGKKLAAAKAEQDELAAASPDAADHAEALADVQQMKAAMPEKKRGPTMEELLGAHDPGTQALGAAPLASPDPFLAPILAENQPVPGGPTGPDIELVAADKKPGTAKLDPDPTLRKLAENDLHPEIDLDRMTPEQFGYATDEEGFVEAQGRKKATPEERHAAQAEILKAVKDGTIASPTMRDELRKIAAEKGLDFDAQVALAETATGKGAPAASPDATDEQRMQVEAEIAKLRADGKLTPEDAATLREWGAAVGLDARKLAELHQHMRPEDVLRAKGMSDEQIEIYKQTLGKDAQYDGGGAKLSDREKAAAKLNSDGSPRVPLSDAEKAVLLEANILLFEDAGEGASARKIIPEASAADYLTGLRMYKGKAQDMSTMSGDAGLVRNTLDMIAENFARFLGLDYEQKPHFGETKKGDYTDAKVDPDTQKASFEVAPHIAEKGVWAIDHTMSAEEAAGTKVPLGGEMHAYALETARKLKELGIAPPKFLELDDKGNLAHVTPRDRKHQDDPSAGTGYTASQGLRDDAGNPYFAPNQEFTVAKETAYKIPEGAKLTNIGADGKPREFATYQNGTWVPAPGLGPDEQARLAAMKAASEKRFEDAQPKQPSR